MMVKFVKTYVDVLAKMRRDGTILPQKVLWEDKAYEIDCIMKISPIPNYKKIPGSDTMKYICEIQGKRKELFLEDNPRRWYVEKPVLQFV